MGLGVDALGRAHGVERPAMRLHQANRGCSADVLPFSSPIRLRGHYGRCPHEGNAGGNVQMDMDLDLLKSELREATGVIAARRLLSDLRELVEKRPAELNNQQ
jgi:hypothetical protein